MLVFLSLLVLLLLLVLAFLLSKEQFVLDVAQRSHAEHRARGQTGRAIVDA